MNHPTEYYAREIMLAVQVIAAAMIFPWLMRSARSAVFVILTAGIFLQLAGLLGDENSREMARCVAISFVWLISLALWRTALNSPRAEAIATAISTSITIGGACSYYFRLEFSDGEISSTWLYAVLISTLVSALIAWSWRKKSYPHIANIASVS